MEQISKTLSAASLLAALAGAAAPAGAAGGHHAVDDAAILEPGQCQLETWFGRATGSAGHLLHAGPACRIAAVEIGLNIDRLRSASAGTSTAIGPQLKWARALSAQLGIGLVVAASWQDGSPRFLGSSLVIPLSYQLSDQWLVHVNAGRDFRAGQADANRVGAALEWAPDAKLALVGEHYREAGMQHWRLGARWNLSEALSLDLSHARPRGGQAPAWWTLGLNLALQR